jgi:hypothetical protein
VIRFFEPDLTINPDSPLVRDASNKLVRRSYWMDMADGTQGIGANLTNDEKRAHLIDLKCQRFQASETDLREFMTARNNRIWWN